MAEDEELVEKSPFEWVACCRHDPGTRTRACEQQACDFSALGVTILPLSASSWASGVLPRRLDRGEDSERLDDMAYLQYLIHDQAARRVSHGHGFGQVMSKSWSVVSQPATSTWRTPMASVGRLARIQPGRRRRWRWRQQPGEHPPSQVRCLLSELEKKHVTQI